MKKLLILAVVAAVALSGCASGKILGFLASTDYVDQKIKAQETEIAALKAQIADTQSLMKDAQAAIEQAKQNTKTIQDLQSLAQRAEARIGQIPKEVIRQIVDILQASLGQ